MIKLNIEMSMAALIGKIARSQDGSTPSGPSAPGINMSLTDPTRKSKAGHGCSHGRRGGGAGESGYVSDTMSPSRKRFNPTVSEVMAGEGDGERMYHAWVSTDANNNAERNARGMWGSSRGAAGGRGEEGEEGTADEEKGYIRKQTQVQVVEEQGVVDTLPKREREPSEDGSTIRLRP
jgi:hypothetical protein